MTSRYANRRIGRNSLPQYKWILKDRDVSFIRQYFTGELHHPTSEELLELSPIGHIWKLGDRYYKLAYKYYGDSTLWWVIAWFNQAPTDSDINIGDLVYVPTPLDKILRIFEV